MGRKQTQNNWIVRLRIISFQLTLDQLIKQSRIKPGMGSFSKGKLIPKWLQILEKRTDYDFSRLQISFEMATDSGAHATAIRILRKYLLSLKTMQRRTKGEVSVEVSIECYVPLRPQYFLAQKQLCDICSEVGASLHLVFS